LPSLGVQFEIDRLDSRILRPAAKRHKRYHESSDTKDAPTRRSWIRRVILPMGNKKDLRDLPAHVRQEMQFHFVERVEEVLSLVIPGIKSETAGACQLIDLKVKT
jgi:hypothetical protein